MTETLNYTDSLNSLKSTFLGGSERNIWVKAISDHFPPKCLRFLDIGTGDGNSLEKTISTLHNERHYEFEITAIDPSFEGRTQLSAIFPNTKLVLNTFENYESNSLFDIVNATQSIYYMPKKLQVLQKMINHTQPNGLMIITLCSRDCILSKLHYAVMGQNSPLWTNAEDIHELLKKHNGIAKIRLEYFRGEVNLNSWKASREILAQAYEVIARGGSSSTSTLNRFGKIVCKYKDIETRTNGVVIAQRAT